MATKSFNRRDIDRLMKGGVGGIIALGIGMALMVAGSIFGVAIANSLGYVVVFLAFALLIWTIYPAFK
ncbi:hypothetical protein SAMN06264855_109118 [Halorubrum vacuolatum]|uniref:Major facilitator superfamily (MFS) profile domain-containing protein n=2 Tax=Halorubrum vacuolatum TaxID=63740 RepID=A0A238WRI1_HALVU|nr:hypothetical protein SAMN06264855_109118 [Halorubrum vacuolatum]